MKKLYAIGITAAVVLILGRFVPGPLDDIGWGLASAYLSGLLK